MGWAEKGLERRMHSEGLLQPDDRVIAVEAGYVPDVVFQRAASLRAQA
jgi:hypothetical protein